MKFAIFGVIFLALLLRLINLNQSLWLDEAINVLAARDLTFWEFVTKYPIGDFHPPGYFAILWVFVHFVWLTLFDYYSHFVFRLPSVLFGVLTICLVYLIGKNLINKKVGLFAAILLAINPLHVYYSQEARMYAMAAFCGSLFVYFLLKYLKDSKKYFFPLIIAVALTLYSDYLVYLLIPAILVFVFWAERKKFTSTVGTFIIGGLFLLPWLLVFPQQLMSGSQTAENVPGWQKVVGGSSIKNFLLVYVKSVIGRVSLDNKILYGGILSFLGLLYGGLTFLALKKLDKGTKLLICWVFLPTIFALIISFFVPVLSYFRMLFIVPGFCLLLAKVSFELPKKFIYPAISALVLISTVCLFSYYLNPKFQREDWKGLFNFYMSQQKPQKLLLFEDSNIPAPYAFHNTCVHKCAPILPGLKSFPANSMNNLADFNNPTIASTETIYLVDYLVEISDPKRLVDKKLVSLGFKVVNVYNFHGVGLVYEYSKTN